MALKETPIQTMNNNGNILTKSTLVIKKGDQLILAQAFLRCIVRVLVGAMFAVIQGFNTRTKVPVWEPWVGVDPGNFSLPAADPWYWPGSVVAM